MKNSLRRIFALALVVMMIASLGMSAFAEGTDPITPVTSINITKSVTKDANAYAPATTYTFAIAPVATNGTGTEDSPFKGPEGGALFEVGESTATSVDITTAPQTGDINGTLSYTETIVFDADKFTVPGVYRYQVAETEGTYAGMTYDKTVRYLDVYVMEDANANNAIVIAGAVMWNGNTKSTAFTNAYDTTEVTVTKTVSGNLGDKTKDFSFTVKVTGASGEWYQVTKGDTVVGKVESGSETGLTVTLKHGETFVIHGLSTGDTYSVTEVITDAEGYTTTVTAATVNGTEGSGTITADTETKEAVAASVTFNNERNATVPTGIAMTVLPFVAMIALAAIVAVLFFQKRERREA